MDSYADVRKLMEEDREALRKQKALHRLMQNADFKELILTGYLELEVLRLARERASVGKDTPQGSDFLNALDAVGYFHNYLNLIEQQGCLAQKSYQEGQAVLDILQESDNE